MRKLFVFGFFICFPLALIFLLLSAESHAQFSPQTAPTQPHVLIVNTKPLPNHNGCSVDSQQCVDGFQYGSASPAQIFQSYCSFENEYFQTGNNSGFPCNGGSPPAEGESLNYPISCFTCKCPAGQLRVDGICVVDQGCNYGIQDFVTGACFSSLCPFGDGSAESCGLAPSCIQSENASLISANGSSPAACICPSGTAWDQTNLTCAMPLCNGFNNSPVGSIFDLSTSQCECPLLTVFDSVTNSCVSQVCSGTQVFVNSLNHCAEGLQCPHGFDLNTNTNTCYKVTNDAQQCSAVNHNILVAFADSISAYAAQSYKTCYLNSSDNASVAEWLALNAAPGGIGQTSYGQTCAAYDNTLSAAYLSEHSQRELQCPACDTTQNYLNLRNNTPNIFGFNTVTFDQNSCQTPEYFCGVRGGIWNSNLNTCMNGNIQDAPTSFSSSSRSSVLNGSSFSSSSSGISSSAAGGAGGSSGSGTSDASGGGGGGGGGGPQGGGGGGGSGGGSAASHSTIVNSSVANPTASTANSSATTSQIIVPASQASANNSTANSASNNSMGGGASSTPNCVNGICGGGSSTGGTGGGGNGGGGNTSTGSGNSSQANTSHASSKGECDPQASNYLDCVGKVKKPFSNHTVATSGATTFDQVNQNYMTRLNASPVIGSFHAVANIIILSDPSCPAFSIDLSETIIGQVISTTIHCQIMLVIFSTLSLVTTIGFSFIAFKIFASA